MKTRPTVPHWAGTFAALALLASPVGAATLSTPAVYLPSTWSLWCTATNIGTKPLENVMLEVVRPNGTVATTVTMGALAPGATNGGGVSGAANFGFFHCRGLNLSKSRAIVTACVRETSGSPCSTVTFNR